MSYLEGVGFLNVKDPINSTDFVLSNDTNQEKLSIDQFRNMIIDAYAQSKGIDSYQLDCSTRGQKITSVSL